MMRIARHGAAFATMGAAVAGALLAYDFLVLVGPDGYSRATDFDAMMIFALCPPSIGLMASEHIHGVELFVVLSIIVAGNAALYGLGGCVVGVGISWQEIIWQGRLGKLTHSLTAAWFYVVATLRP